VVISLRHAVYEVVPPRIRKLTFAGPTSFVASFLFMSKPSSLPLEDTNICALTLH
jgi:hypothetical protein